MDPRPSYAAHRTLAVVAVLLGGCSPSVTSPPPPVASIVVSAPHATMNTGASQRLTAVARTAAGDAVSARITWHTSAASVATVDASGTVTAVAVGVANITASSGNVTSNEVGITVTAVVGPVGSIVIDKAAVLLPGAGQTARLTAKLFDGQGSQTTGTVSWTSSTPDQVSVGADGKVTGNAIGSAQVVASVGGIHSAPTLVSVAEPQPGALLLTDAQVVSVGAPSVAPGDTGGVGTRYDVTVQGVTAPAAGTVVLGSETAPIAGTVVGSHPAAGGGTVITLAIAPISQLFSNYDVRYTLDLSGDSAESVPASGQLRRDLAPSEVWNAAKRGRPSGAPVAGPLSPFQAFDCEASIKPQLTGTPISLSLTNNLTLQIEDRPGYSKHALTGSAALTGNVGLQLQVGFKASGKCQAQAQLKLPVFGWFSVIAMPAVRFGLGAALTGDVKVVQAQLGVEGKAGVTITMGWECTQAAAASTCKGLDDIAPDNQFKTKSKFPDAHGLQATASAQFYLVAGLDLAILGGLANAGIVEARIGPKQSFDLAFEEDQAARTDYASSYDLKIDGVVEPGAALKKAIEQVIGDGQTEVSFKASFSNPISTSPKGTLTADKTAVSPGDAVTFAVDFDAQSVAYYLLGYNVTGVELYRKGDNDQDFTDWKAMSLTGSNHANYTWTPGATDNGNYQFAALVQTQLDTPLLEVAANSIVPVRVGNNWTGTVTFTQMGDTTYEGNPAFGETVHETWGGTATLELAGQPDPKFAGIGSLPFTLTKSTLALTHTTETHYDFTSGDCHTVGDRMAGSGANGDINPSNDPVYNVQFSDANYTLRVSQVSFNGQGSTTTDEKVDCTGQPETHNHSVDNYGDFFDLPAIMLQQPWTVAAKTITGETTIHDPNSGRSVKVQWTFNRVS